MALSPSDSVDPPLVLCNLDDAVVVAVVVAVGADEPTKSNNFDLSRFSIRLRNHCSTTLCNCSWLCTNRSSDDRSSVLPEDPTVVTSIGTAPAFTLLSSFAFGIKDEEDVVGLLCAAVKLVPDSSSKMRQISFSVMRSALRYPQDLEDVPTVEPLGTFE